MVPEEKPTLAEQLRRANEQLMASTLAAQEVAANYRAIFDAANDAIFVHDLETGAVLDVNQKMTEMYGYTREEARHLTVEAMSAGTPPYTQQDALRWLRKVSAGEPQLFEWLAKDKTGRLFWVEVNTKRAAIGGKDRLLAIARDITERRRAQEQLRKAHDELERRVDERTTKLTLANAELRCQQDELQARNAELQAQAEEIQAQDEVLQIQNEELRAANEALVDSRHALAESQKRLLTQFQQLSTIFDSINALVYVADMETYELLFINAYGAELFGGDSVGWPCYLKLQAGQTAQCAFCTNDRLVREGVPQPPYVWEFQNTVTGRWFLCIDRAINWVDGRLVRLEIAVDISERKMAEERREEYVHTISHDLRNPLALIQAHAQLLQHTLSAAGGGGQERQSASAIVATARVMNTMIQDLVDAARIESGQMKIEARPLDIRSYILDLKERMAAVEGAERIVVDAAESLSGVLADPNRLERILTNLISNALKYSAQDAEVKLTLTQREGEVITAVADRGAGIAPAELPRLFERYYRTRVARERREGLGLGLYITRGLVEAHGGRVWAESTAGEGSTFYFTLPVAQDRTHGVPAGEFDRGAAAGSSSGPEGQGKGLE